MLLNIYFLGRVDGVLRPVFVGVFVFLGTYRIPFRVCFVGFYNNGRPLVRGFRFGSYRALAAGLWAGGRPRPPTVFARLYGLAKSIIGNYSF